MSDQLTTLGAVATALESDRRDLSGIIARMPPGDALLQRVERVEEKLEAIIEDVRQSRCHRGPARREAHAMSYIPDPPGYNPPLSALIYGARLRRKQALGLARHEQEQRAYWDHGARKPRDYRAVRHMIDTAVEVHADIRRLLRPHVEDGQKLTAADVTRIAAAARTTATVVRYVHDGMLGRNNA